MGRHLLDVCALAVLVAACTPVPNAGSPGGSGGVAAPGGSGGEGGHPGGSGGSSEGPPCPDPENEALCWALGEEGWTTAPGMDFVPEVAIAAAATPGPIPATTLAWTDCGPGCTRASTALFHRDDEVGGVESLAVYRTENGPVALAMVTNMVTEYRQRFSITRTVRLEDGSTLAALRCIESDDDAYVRCMFWAHHPLHTAVFAYRNPEEEQGHDASATYQPSAGGFVFRQPWSTDVGTSGVLCHFEVVRGGEGPVPLCFWGGSVSVLADPLSANRTPLFETSGGIRNFATEGAGAAWISGRSQEPWVRHAWELGGEVRSSPLPTPGAREPTPLGLGANRLALALQDGTSTVDTGYGFLAHRLLWLNRDPATDESRLDEPLVGGEPLRIVKLVATDGYAAAIIERGGIDVRRPSLLVARQADGFARVVRDFDSGVWLWTTALAVSGDTLWVTAPREGQGYFPGQLYRYDLSQLEAL